MLPNIILILAGLYCIVGLGIFMFRKNSRKMQRIMNLFGESGARAFYIVLGLILLLVGIFVRF